MSGSVDPFDTPGLGPWLADQAADWDVVCCWKLDRLSRNAIHLNRLFGWCLDHDKTVVSATEAIDLSTPVGRLIANVIGFLAEGELDAIRERQRASRAKLRESARWPGGKPPYGYMAVARTGGGWSLEVDPEASLVVRRIVDDLLDGTPITRIARELTAEGYRTPSQYYTAKRAGLPALRWTPDETPTGQWSATPLKNMLRSKALRGFAHHQGETVRDDRGLPVQLAEPLVTLDEWELIQATLDRTLEARKDNRRSEASPLAGLLTCNVSDADGECGAKLHHDLNTVKRADRVYEYRYYRCQNRAHSMIPADMLEEAAAQAFLDEFGDTEVRERVWVPGDTREAELREAVASYDELIKAAGRAVSATAKQRLQAQLAALDAQIAELESAPAREARWEYRPTGETYRTVWQASNAVERREMLAKAGITIAASLHGGDRRSHNAGWVHLDIRVFPDGGT